MVKHKKRAIANSKLCETNIVSYFKRQSAGQISNESFVTLSDDDSPEVVDATATEPAGPLKTLDAKQDDRSRRKRRGARQSQSADEARSDISPTSQKENMPDNRKRSRKSFFHDAPDANNAADGACKRASPSADNKPPVLPQEPVASVEAPASSKEVSEVPKSAPVARSYATKSVIRRFTNTDYHYPTAGMGHVGYVAAHVEAGATAHPVADSRRTCSRARAEPCALVRCENEGVDASEQISFAKPNTKKIKQAVRSWGSEAKKVFDEVTSQAKADEQQPLALTEQFRPRIRDNFFANLGSVNEMYEWFASWRKRLDRDPPTKENPSKKSRSRGDESDEDYVEEHRSLPNPVILCGPLGSGKTSMAHCIAEESGFKVLELPVGDKRDASALKLKISGALSSYYVNNQGADIRSMFQSKSNDTGKEKTTRAKHTAVFIDDVDVLYSTDDRFWTTLKSLCAEARIPIILACSNFKSIECCLHDPPGLEDYRVITLSRATESQFVEYLQPWILARSHHLLEADAVKKFVRGCGGDVRQTMAELHFQLLSNSKLDSSDRPARAGSTAPWESVVRRLAELDSVIGATSHESVRWTATDEADLDYAGPRSDDRFPLERHLREVFDVCCTTMPGGCGGPQKVNRAIRDCRLRSRPRELYPLSAVALDYAPAMLEMHKSHTQRTKLSRRSIHPFAEVNIHTQTAIDTSGQLAGSISGYQLPMSRSPF